jgi:hypothetical protein
MGVILRRGVSYQIETNGDENDRRMLEFCTQKSEVKSGKEMADSHLSDEEAGRRGRNDGRRIDSGCAY